MLLNKSQKAQFILDYPVLNMPQLSVKYGASSRKIREIATAMGLEKIIGRPLGAKDKKYRERSCKY